MSKGEAASFKVLIIGNAEVGKTAIVNAWASSIFNPSYEPTLSPELTQCVIGVDNDQIRLQVWDLGFTQLDSDKQLSTYAHGAAAAVLVYDCNSESSAASVSYWHEKLQGRMASDCTFIVVGCKADKLDYSGAAVQRARAFAASVGAQHTDVSARTGANVARLFESLARALAASGTPHPSSTLEGESDTSVQSVTDTLPEVPTVPTDTSVHGQVPTVPSDTSMAISWPLGAMVFGSSPMETAQQKLARAWTRPCKMVLLGDPGVGKTCMANSLAGTGKDAGLVKDYVPTAGLEMMAKLIDPDGASIKLQIWDAGGSDLMQEARLRSAVLQGFDLAVIMYDVAAPTSFQSVNTWFRSIEEMHRGTDSVVMLLGSDGNLTGRQLSRVISESEGSAKAEKLGVPFAELSTQSETQVTNLIHSFFAGCVQNRPFATDSQVQHEQSLLGTSRVLMPTLSEVMPTLSQAQPIAHNRSVAPPQPQEPGQPEPLPRWEAKSSGLRPTESEIRRGYMGSTTASKLKESAEPVESEIRRGHVGGAKLKEALQPVASESRRGYMARTVASKSKESEETTQIGQKDSSQVPRAMERATPRSNHGTSIKIGRPPSAAQATQSQHQVRQMQHPLHGKRPQPPSPQQPHVQPVSPSLPSVSPSVQVAPPWRQIPQLQQDQGPVMVPQWDQRARSMSPLPVRAQPCGSPILQPSSPRQEISAHRFAQLQQLALGSPPVPQQTEHLTNPSSVAFSWQPGIRTVSPPRAFSPGRSRSPEARPLRFPGLAAMEPMQAHTVLPPPQMPCVAAADSSQDRARSPSRTPVTCGRTVEPVSFGQPLRVPFAGLMRNRCASPMPPSPPQPMGAEKAFLFKEYSMPDSEPGLQQGRMQLFKEHLMPESELFTSRPLSPGPPPMGQDRYAFLSRSGSGSC